MCGMLDNLRVMTKKIGFAKDEYWSVAREDRTARPVMSFRGGAAGSALIGISFRQMRRNLSFSPRCSSHTARRCARSFACRPFVLVARDISRRLSLDSTSRHCAAAVGGCATIFCSSVLQNERARTHERNSSSAPRSCRSCRSIVFFRHGAEMPPGTARTAKWVVCAVSHQECRFMKGGKVHFT